MFSLGEDASPERELVQRFYDGLERYTPDLVSWNGSGFDLPVLSYRALKHGISARTPIGRLARPTVIGASTITLVATIGHIDLMDVLSAYGASSRASLDTVAQLIGRPGKLGMSGAHVWPAFLRGEIARSATTARPTC